jgi:hypothetical protein
LGFAGQHTDWGALTVLAVDDQAGLEVELDGRWLPVPPRPGTFIVNVGDLLQRYAGSPISFLASQVHSCLCLGNALPPVSHIRWVLSLYLSPGPILSLPKINSPITCVFVNAPL